MASMKKLQTVAVLQWDYLRLFLILTRTFEITDTEGKKYKRAILTTKNSNVYEAYFNLLSNGSCDNSFCSSQQKSSQISFLDMESHLTSKSLMVL